MTGRGGINLFGAVLGAPLIAVHPDDPTVLHAVTMDALIALWPLDDDTPFGGFVTACWTYGCFILPVRMVGGERLTEPAAVHWPPRVSALAGSGRSRCRECWTLTGRRSPRSDLSVSESAEAVAS